MPTINLDTAALQAGFKASIANAVATETALGQADATQLEALAAELFPLMVAEAQAMITSPSASQYMAIINGVMASKAAELAVGAIETQKDLIATEAARWAVILATVLKAAV